MFQSVNTTLWKILISSVSSCLTWNIVPIISHCRLKVQHMHRNVHTHTYTDNVCMHTLARFYMPYKYVPYGGHTHTSMHAHTHLFGSTQLFIKRLLLMSGNPETLMPCQLKWHQQILRKSRNVQHLKTTIWQIHTCSKGHSLVYHYRPLSSHFCQIKN